MRQKSKPYPVTDKVKSKADSIADLARILGISRQLVIYHRNHGGPKSLGIEEWRAHLDAHGKPATPMAPREPSDVDIRHERALRERAERRIAEVEASVAERDAMPTAEVEAVFNRIMSAVRQQFLSAPSLAASVNPADPDHARTILADYTDRSLKFCRDFKLTPEEK